MMDRFWVKALLFPGVFLVVFGLAFWMGLPEDELADIAKRNIEHALGDKYDVTFGTFSISGVSAVEAESVNIKSRPPSLDASEEELEAFKANLVDMTIDRVYIDVELFKSVFSRSPVVDFEVGMGAGSVVGTYSQVAYEPMETLPKRRAGKKGRTKGKDNGKDKNKDEESEDEAKAEKGEGEPELKGHQVELTFNDLPLNSIEILEAKLGAPLGGLVAGTVVVLMDQKGSRMLDCNIDLVSSATTIGPGPLPFDTGFGKFQIKQTVLGDLVIKVAVEGPKLEIEEVSTSGPDLEFEAAGNITLARTFSGSTARINARAKPSATFLKANELEGILDLDPKVRRAKVGEYYGFIVSGPIASLKPIPNRRSATGIENVRPKGKTKGAGK
jgi:hypothetical protein